MSNQSGLSWPKPLQTVTPSHALEAWRDGLLTEDEARLFFGFGPKVKPCEGCKK